MVRCPKYHDPGVGPLVGCEQLWEDAMEIADGHCPTAHDPIGDCEPAWVTASREPARETNNLPDLDHYQEQQ